MSDRTYAWFAIPTSVLAAPSLRNAVARIFSIPAPRLDLILAAQPLPEEAGYDDGCAVRLVEGVPCLVCENADMDDGGADYEADLGLTGVPYLHRHDGGDEYGPACSARRGHRDVWIRCDQAGEPICGIGMVDGAAEVAEDELRDLETYTRLRADILGLGLVFQPSTGAAVI